MLSQKSAVLVGAIALVTAATARLSAEELPPPAEKQVVLETSYGEIVLEVFPQAAPHHVEKFLERVKAGFYDGTAFHRVIPFGIIQGGDPLSRDPAKRAQYGTGGLGEIKKENRPPPEAIPFVDSPVAELEKYRAVIHTALGDIRLAFYPQDAPEHVRQFLRFAKLGLYDGTTFLRVVPGFVLQGGLMDTRKPPVPDKYQPLLKPLKAEFNQHKHVRGVLSMARTDDPNSGMDSFFIVLDTQPHLDGKYTAFGFVEAGMEVVDAIVARPVSGESPVEPLALTVEVREK